MAWTTTGNLRGPQGLPGNIGAAGISVTNGAIQGDGTLLLTLSNSTTVNAGVVVGPKGADGTSVTITGSVANAAALPTGLNSTTDVGKGYITQDDGHLHVWSGTSFTDAGNITGPAGAQGAPGSVGPRGSKWFVITGTPNGTNTAGSIAGDMALDESTGDIYQLS